MDLLFFPIFPEGALAHSVTTCVWIGVFVIVMFNLRFGWVLTGLVVPGYLAPLVFVKPMAAAVVVFEALVTYLLVYWFSERGSRLGLWSGLFGRDRFFALVIVSIAVRLLFDAWLFPELAVWLLENYNLPFDFRNNLHSFGLIIICLLANQFWKTGLLRGVLPVALPILITCLIIRFVLMEFTNFSIGNLSYIYEDVAASLLASPKAYMVLILAAFIASRMNLHYGWDFNGILIPALLALQWYQPEKILVSFVEAAVILVIARAVLKLPWFGHVNIEGGRKLLLFFNISFAYKLLLGWAVLWLDIDVKATDYYGFGYLLPTLIALKMHDKEIVARLSRATLQTSLTAVVLASVVAFALSRVDWPKAYIRTVGDEELVAGVRQTWKPLTEVLRDETLSFYQHRSVDNFNKPLALELDRFNYALRLLEQNRELQSEELLEQAAGLLATLNFEVVVHPEWLLLLEKEPSLGWGSYVLARQPERQLTLEVPAPLENGHLVQVSAHLFELYGASSLAIAGSQLHVEQQRDPLSLLDQTSVFQAFHRFSASDDVLQLRALTPFNQQRLGTTDNLSASMLRLDEQLPRALDLRSLESLVGPFTTYFDAPDVTNVQRDTANAGFAELYLANDSVRQLLYSALMRNADDAMQASALVKSEYLNEWIAGYRQHIAVKGSNAYQSPSQAELLYLDEQVLMPMLEWIDRYARNPEEEEALEALAGINSAARVVRHQVGLLFADTADPQLFLAPVLQVPVRHSALVVVRSAETAAANVVQAPRPLAEPGTLEFALNLYQETRSRALIVSGAHAAANTDGSADVLRMVNSNSLFSLASQRLVRSAGTTPLVLTQIRGLSRRNESVSAPADVLVSRRFMPMGEIVPAANELNAFFENRALRVTEVDGSRNTIGYESHLILQNRYLDQSRNKLFQTLWVSPEPRHQERFKSSNRQLLAQLASLGLNPQQGSLSERLLQGSSPKSIAAGVAEKLRRYQRNGDVVLLADLLEESTDLYAEALIDRRSQQLYLLVGLDRLQIAGAFLLGEGSDAGRRVGPEQLAREVAEFVDQRETWLTVGGPS